MLKHTDVIKCKSKFLWYVTLTPFILNKSMKQFEMRNWFEQLNYSFLFFYGLYLNALTSKTSKWNDFVTTHRTDTFTSIICLYYVEKSIFLWTLELSDLLYEIFEKEWYNFLATSLSNIVLYGVISLVLIRHGFFLWRLHRLVWLSNLFFLNL